MLTSLPVFVVLAQVEVTRSWTTEILIMVVMLALGVYAMCRPSGRT